MCLLRDIIVRNSRNAYKVSVLRAARIRKRMNNDGYTECMLYYMCAYQKLVKSAAPASDGCLLRFVPLLAVLLYRAPSERNSLQLAVMMFFIRKNPVVICVLPCAKALSFV